MVLVSLVWLAMTGLGYAQATTVQQTASMPNACTPMNTTAAVNATATLTIPAPPSNQYIYLCGLDITVSFDGTGGTVSTNVSFTSTNLGPTGSTWAWKTSWVGTANTTIEQPFIWQLPVRATNPGASVTVVSPAANLHGAYSITAYYYTAQ